MTLPVHGDVCLANSKDGAVAAARAFAAERYPAASLVFLGGSWASGSDHPDSDLDVVIVDDTAEGVSFEGTTFQGFVVEACVLPSALAAPFFSGSAEHRSAPVPPQVSDGLLVVGNEDSASVIRRSANDAIAAGPKPLSEEEIAELRYELSLLLVDLQHAGPEVLTGVAAFTHVALSKALIDLSRAWRADRKSLRKAVAALDPNFANELDAALIEACAGHRGPIVALCERILGYVGGSQRTYTRFTTALTFPRKR